MKQIQKSTLATEDMDLMVRGQVGNIRAKIMQMSKVLTANELDEYQPLLLEVSIEVDYLEKYLPPMKLRKPPK